MSSHIRNHREDRRNSLPHDFARAYTRLLALYGTMEIQGQNTIRQPAEVYSTPNPHEPMTPKEEKTTLDWDDLCKRQFVAIQIKSSRDESPPIVISRITTVWSSEITIKTTREPLDTNQ